MSRSSPPSSRDPDSPYRVVGLLDDGPAKRNDVVRGVRVVGGRHDIASAAERLDATGLVIAIPGAGSELHPRASPTSPWTPGSPSGCSLR